MDDQNDALQNSYKLSLEKIIEYDIHLIEKSDIEGKQIFILQDIGNQKVVNSLGELLPVANSKFLYHEKKFSFIFVDVQKLKEIIDEILPSTLKYQISYNTTIINNTQSLFDLTNSYVIGKKLKINLKLDERSTAIKSNRDYLIKIVILDIIISFVFMLLIVAIFYRYKRQFNRIILKQKQLLYITKKRIKESQEDRLAKKEIDSHFVKKATEIYTKQELDAIENNNELKDKILKNIGTKDYIFPLILKGISRSTIELDDFFVNLEKSLSSHMFKSMLSINIATKYLNIECDKEVFYQVILSLTTNIMMFLENQSDEVKYINVEVLENKIIYTYIGYPLSRDNIIKLSSFMPTWSGDAFLLTGAKLFQSIDYHNMVYNSNSDGFKNKIELLFCAEKNKNKTLRTQIIDFVKLKRKRK
jgi:hypothetical protein